MISSYDKLVNEFASSLIENEVTFDDLKLTASIIREYIKMDPIAHLHQNIDDNIFLWQIIQQYGIGNYDDAKRDLDEFSALFN
jgi:hypothetical protein